MRRPCFVEGDVGLASLTEPTTASSTTRTTTTTTTFFSRSTKRSPSYRSLSSSCFGASTSSPRFSARLYDSRCEEPHFLEACFLCKKPLGDNRDIFMYRGDTPFCSEECRQEQIEMDEAKEKKWNLSASMKAIRNETTKSTPNKSQNYQARTSPPVAAT